jgi:exosortase
MIVLVPKSFVYREGCHTAVNLHIKPKQMPFAFCCACVIAMLGYVFMNGTAALAFQWLRLEQYWKFLIVLVSAYVVWDRRGRLFRLRPRPSYGTGMALIAVGCIAFALWKLFIIDFFIEMALLFLLTGCISLLLGNGIAKPLLFPVGYLVLTTSLVERALAPVAVIMQYASAMATETILNLGGWDVLRDGRFLRLPHTVLEVATECSGAGQLTALIAFAIPLGFMMHKSTWPRIALLLLTLPFALAVNTIRIILVALWNYDGLKSAVHGPHEILRMPFIYPLALVFLYLCSLFFARIERKKALTPAGAQESGSVGVDYAHKSIWPAWLCCFCTLVLTLAAVGFAEARPFCYAENLGEFPFHINAWNSERTADTLFSGMISFYFGKPEAVLCRTYRNETGAALTLFIARFDVQNTSKRISSVQFNSFRNGEKVLEIAAGPSTTFKAMLTDAAFQKRPVSTLSWFSVDGRTYPSIAGARKRLIDTTIKKRRNNAAFIAISMDGDDPQRSEEQLSSFAAAIFPYVKNVLR